MQFSAPPRPSVIKRVRAILLTGKNSLMFIKRIKPNDPIPYWVAPGGGVEIEDDSLHDALYRELGEELGAHVEILDFGFTLKHTKAEKNLEEHFFICRLLDYDLTNRTGPEFADPTRGEYIPDVIPLTQEALAAIEFRTQELHTWLLSNLDRLRSYNLR